MKKIAIFLSFLTLLGCEPKFNPNDEWKAIDVVYCVLDADAPQLYVQVNKGFQNTDGNAIDLAKINDSIYHQDSMIVELIELNNNNTIIHSKQLKKTLFSTKEAGIFANPDHYLYVIDSVQFPVKEDGLYRLRVTNPVTQKTTVSTIKSVKKSVFGIVWSGGLTVAFADQEGIKSQDFFIRNDNSTNIAFSLQLILPVLTTNSKGDTLATDTIRYAISNGSKAGAGIETRLTLTGEVFYNSIIDGLEPVPNGLGLRRFFGLPLLVSNTFGPEMFEYTLAEENFNAISQTKPFYTNINDLATNEPQAGLFTSSKSNTQILFITTRTVNYLKENYASYGF